LEKNRRRGCRIFGAKATGKKTAKGEKEEVEEDENEICNRGKQKSLSHVMAGNVAKKRKKDRKINPRNTHTSTPSSTTIKHTKQEHNSHQTYIKN
jgi:hypothetical protein